MVASLTALDDLDISAPDAELKNFRLDITAFLQLKMEKYSSYQTTLRSNV